MNSRKTLTDAQENILKAIDSCNHRLLRAIRTFGKDSLIVKGMAIEAKHATNFKMARSYGKIARDRKTIDELSTYPYSMLIEKLERITQENTLLNLERSFGKAKVATEKDLLDYLKGGPRLSDKEIKERLETVKRDIVYAMSREEYYDDEYYEDGYFLPTDIDTWDEI